MAKRESKKDERKRRLLFLILLFVLTLSVGGVATYAWFTSNTAVSVDPLDVQVKTANGLQISADAINWSALITNQKLKEVRSGDSGTYPTATNQLPSVFDNVSTIGTVASGKMTMFHGTVTGDKNDGGKLKLSAAQAAAEADCDGTTAPCDTRYYDAFDIFLRVNDDTDVVLAPTSGVVKTDAADRGIQNTVRVGFVINGHWDATTAAATMQAGSTGTSVLIWEPNSDTHTANGIQNAQEIYGITTTATASPITYKGVKQAIAAPGLDLALTGPTTTQTAFDTVTPLKIQTSSTNDQPIDLFVDGSNRLPRLQAGVTKIRVYWWVEGQDVDTENNATNSNMRLTLDFAIKGTV